MKPNYPFKLAALLLFSLNSVAQPRGYVKQSALPKSLQRIEFGFSSVNSASDYSGTFVSVKDGKRKEWPQDGPSISKGGLGVKLGTFYRLALIGKQTAIAADVSFMYNMMYWNIGKGFFIDDSWTISGQTKQFALPVGLDLKFGCDARLEKNHRFCASFGGGIIPTRSSTVLPNDTNEKLKFRYNYATPYFKVEAGFFARVCWKLRLTYTWGKMQYVDDGLPIGKNSDRAVFHYTNTGRSTMMLSVIIMPFSYDWPDNGWWNNSKTSKMMY